MEEVDGFPETTTFSQGAPEKTETKSGSRLQTSHKASKTTTSHTTDERPATIIKDNWMMGKGSEESHVEAAARHAKDGKSKGHSGAGSTKGAQTGLACQRIIRAHTDVVNSVHPTPDGRYMISASHDSTAKVFQLGTFECVATLQGHSDIVLSVCASPDSKTLATGGGDAQVMIWSTDTFACKGKLTGHTGWIHGLAITSDNQRIVSCSEDKTVRLWNLATYETLASLEGHTSRIWTIALFPDDKHVVSGSDDDTIRIWNLQTLSCVKVLHQEECTLRALAVHVCPGGREFLSAGVEGVRIWSTKTFECVAHLGVGQRTAAVAMTPDRNYIISAGDALHVWNVETKECLATLQGHTEGIWGLCALGDNDHIVSCGSDKTARVWSIAQALAALKFVRNNTEEAFQQALSGTMITTHIREVDQSLEGATLSLIQTDPMRAMEAAGHGRLPCLANEIVSSKIQDLVLEFVADEPNQAIAALQAGRLAHSDVPLVRTALFRAALGSDINVAMDIAKDFFKLPVDPEYEDPIRARLRPGDFIVGDELLIDEDFYLLKHESPTATKVKTQVLQLDMNSLCSTPGDRKSLFTTLVESNKAELFRFLPLRAAVQLRWQNYGRSVFITEALLHLVALGLILVLSLTTNDWSQAPAHDHFAVTIALMALASLLALDETYQFVHDPLGHFSSLWNWLDVSRSGLMLAFGGLHLQGDDRARTVLAFAAVLQWLGLLYFLLPFERTGPLILMILQILRDTYVFLMVLFAVVLGATNSFFLFLHDRGADGFGDVALALFTTINMLLFGDYDQHVFAESTDGLSARLIFVAVMFMVLVILLNLLIAILSDSYERVQDRSAIELTLTKARILDGQHSSLQLWVHKCVLFLWGGIIFVVWMMLNVLTLFRHEYKLSRWLGRYFGRRFGFDWKEMFVLLLHNSVAAVGTWPDIALVLIPEHAEQTAEPRDRWQGMLNDIKTNISDIQATTSHELKRADAVRQEQADRAEVELKRLESKLDTRVDKLQLHLGRVENKLDHLLRLLSNK
eukprot:m.238925 g.238925  ORF g.238925 m.238925 type:complete len:1029 (-) comp17117_c0_seq3:453-3539(-)